MSKKTAKKQPPTAAKAYRAAAKKNASGVGRPRLGNGAKLAPAQFRLELEDAEWAQSVADRFGLSMHVAVREVIEAARKSLCGKLPHVAPERAKARRKKPVSAARLAVRLLPETAAWLDALSKRIGASRGVAARSILRAVRKAEASGALSIRPNSQ